MNRREIRFAGALLLMVASAGCQHDQSRTTVEPQFGEMASTPPQATGWKPNPDANRREVGKEDTPPSQKPPLTKKEQERYDRVALKLVEAINARDKKGYRGLFTDEAWTNAIDWWRNMFVNQVLKFGAIERAYPAQRGIVRVGKMGMGGDERNGASFIVIFGKKAGGLLSFELNDKDKIVHTSVFVNEELAQYNGWIAKPIFEKAR